MKRLSVLIHALVFAIGFLPAVSASAHDQTRTGDRVRIRTSDGTRTIGQLSDWNSESIVVNVNGESRSIPVDDVTRVDRQTGTKSHTLAGGLIGAGLGMMIGYAVAEQTKPESTFFDSDPEPNHGLSMLLAGICGLAVGMLFGSGAETPQWEPLDVGDVSFGVQPQASTGPPLALAWSLGF